MNKIVVRSRNPVNKYVKNHACNLKICQRHAFDIMKIKLTILYNPVIMTQRI